jgi:GT2 family glycosyltransferase
MIIENIGLLDESYFMYVEDLDYSYKVWKVGYNLYHINNISIYHKVGASSGEEVSEVSAYWMMRNRVKFLKRKPLARSVLNLFLLFLSRSIAVIRFILMRKFYIIKAQLRGIKDGFGD